MRGDTSDNVFSAYPGVRVKGTKNKVGLQEAYADKKNKGYAWNNFMLQRWVDHEEVEHRVKDDFERNKILIDLTQQPDEIREECVDIISNAKQRETIQNVGIHFMKFCNKWNLQRMSDSPGEFAELLNSDIKKLA